MATATVINLTGSQLSVLSTTIGPHQTGSVVLDDSKFQLVIPQLDQLRNSGYISYSLVFATDSGLSVIASSTSQNLDLYVNPTSGKDTNPGTATSPFQTIQAALNVIPKLVLHQVIVHLAAGNHYASAESGFGTITAHGFTFGPSGSLQVLGVTTTVLLDAQIAASVTSPNNVDFVVHVSGAAFTVNQYKGAFLEITGGTGHVAETSNVPHNRNVIIANDATTITVAGGLNTLSMDATTTFRIVTPSAKVYARLSTSGAGVSTSKLSVVDVRDVSGTAAYDSPVRGLYLINLDLIAENGHGVFLQNAAACICDCICDASTDISGTTSAAFKVGRNANLHLVDSLVNVKAVGGFTYDGISQVDSGSNVQVDDCVIWGGGSAIDISGASNYAHITYSHISAAQNTAAYCYQHGNVASFSDVVLDSAPGGDGFGAFLGGFIIIDVVSGTAGSHGMQATQGGRIYTYNSTVTGTSGDIIIDGTAKTYANLTGAANKALNNANTLSTVISG